MKIKVYSFYKYNIYEYADSIYFMNYIGEKIRQLRTQKGFSQEYLVDEHGLQVRAIWFLFMEGKHGLQIRAIGLVDVTFELYPLCFSPKG